MRGPIQAVVEIQNGSARDMKLPETQVVTEMLLSQVRVSKSLQKLEGILRILDAEGPASIVPAVSKLSKILACA